MTAAVVPLEPDEETVWAGRPRLATALPETAGSLVVVIAAIVTSLQVGEPLVLLGLAGLAWPLWKFLVVTNTAFLVTDSACYRKTGVLSRDVRRIGLERVQNSGFRQGIRGALFGYGTVVIEAAGGGRLQFHAVRDPAQVRALVDSRAGGSEVPGSLEVWEAVLAEVRALRRAVVHG